METSKFFDVELFLENIKKEYNLDKWEGNFYFFAAPRDIGKSYSAWELAVKRFLNSDNKLAYVRITDTQLKKPKKEFNNKYKDRFLISEDNIIYSLTKTNKANSEGYYYSKNEIVGYVCSINNYINEKSNFFDNVSLIFVDEINEDSNNNIGLYAKMSNLFTTIIRKRKDTTIIMLANRDTANNEIMVKWGIEPREDKDIYDDIVYRVDDNIFYIELGDKWYIELENNLTLFHQFAKYDKKSSRQLHGKYAVDFSKQVKNFDKWIAPSFKPIFGIAIQKVKYFYGSFNINNRITYALVSNENYSNESINIYSLDNISGILKDVDITDFEDVIDIYEMFFKKIKSLNLFYDSFDTKNIFENALTIIYNYHNKYNINK